VQMDVEYVELMRRISGRRTCADCGRVFNVLTTSLEEIEGDKCPKTGEPHKLFQRPDDTEETVANRLKVYEDKTRPLIDFYRKKGILQSIDAQGDVEEITARLEKALQAAAKKPARAKKKSARTEAAGKSAAAGVPAKKAPAKKVPARKSAAKKVPAKTAGKSGRVKTAAGKTEGKKSAVKGVRRRSAVAKSGRKAKKAPVRRAPAKKKSAAKKRSR